MASGMGLGEVEAHFVAGGEAEFFVEGLAAGGGVEDGTGAAEGFEIVEGCGGELLGESLAAVGGFDVDSPDVAVVSMGGGEGDRV